MGTRGMGALPRAAGVVMVVASVGLAAAAPAGAAVRGRDFRPSGGLPVMTDAGCGAASITPASDTVGESGDCAQTGYLATGRSFRYAQAMITVPDSIGEVESSPTVYVALDDPSAGAFDYARVGAQPCVSTGGGATCPGDSSGWQAFASVDQSGAADTETWPLPSSSIGGGILVSVYAGANGDAFTVSFPGGTVDQVTLGGAGSVYPRAEALVDWAPAEAGSASDVVDCRVVITGPMRETIGGRTPCRASQFFDGHFTTAAGARGTFRGPWTLTPVEATADGTVAGTLLSGPSYLWRDTMGPSGDAFGAWVYQPQIGICGSPRHPAGHAGRGQGGTGRSRTGVREC